MSESSNAVSGKIEAPRTQSIWDRLRIVSPFGILFTVFVGGVVLSTNFWSSTISGLQADLRRSGEELRRSREESGRINGEFLEYRAKHPEKNPSSPEKARGQIKNHRPPQSAASNSTVSGDAVVAVQVGETATVKIASDQLLISLIGVSFDDKSAHYRLTANIAGSDREPMKIQGEIGDVFYYEGKVKYRIRILEIKSFLAKFSIAAA